MTAAAELVFSVIPLVREDISITFQVPIVMSDRPNISGSLPIRTAENVNVITDAPDRLVQFVLISDCPERHG